jgi:hypothetical protein
VISPRPRRQWEHDRQNAILECIEFERCFDIRDLADVGSYISIVDLQPIISLELIPSLV